VFQIRGGLQNSLLVFNHKTYSNKRFRPRDSKTKTTISSWSREAPRRTEHT
jgi:hypothetical protein